MVELVRLEPITVIGLRVEAPWNQLFEAVPDAWRQLFRRADDLRRFMSQKQSFLEVSVDVRDGVYTELVGVQAQNAPAACPVEMRRLDIPAGEWLHLVHTGPLAGIADGFSALYAHAETAGLAVSDVKLDFGYTAAGEDRPHDLYLSLKSNDAPRWRERTPEELENG
ncbi:GyrI-like domain-containing protein [Devosia nitrariae]|uniref:GyrI-like domain-containing protein n=1 Tax=Devosia nitrariae TaxID=2071872 RepID=UPI0024E08AAD|nr:GyrI-like domain-containing protein [Devosia nitrariae]